MDIQNNNSSKAYFDSSNLYVFLYRYRKSFLIIAVISFAVSAIVSMNIEEKYKSTAIIYPSNTSSIAKVLINPNYGGMADIMGFGEEEKSEQLLEILGSDRLKTRVIERFNLMQHYRIDPSKTATPNHDLYEQFDNNISFKRNKNMAVVVEVLDHSPDTAALIASALLSILDDVMNEIHKERANQGFLVVEKSYKKLKEDLQVLEDSLKFIMGKGVLNVTSQAEVYGDAYAQAISKGNKQAIAALEEKLDILSKYGSQYLSLREKIENETSRLSELKGKYEEAKVDAMERLNNFFVVSSPYAAEKKSYPIRWLIVVLSVSGALFTGVFAILFFEQFQKVRTKL